MVAARRGWCLRSARRARSISWCRVRRATPTGGSSGSSSTSAPQQSRTRPPRRRQLAASPVHGTYAPGNLVLRPEILRAGQRVLAAADPHGRLRTCSMAAAARAGKSPRRHVRYGVVKVNVDTDNQYAFTRPVAATARPLAGRAQGGRRDRRQAQLRPLSVGRAGKAVMGERVRQACEQLGSTGRTFAAGQ